MTDEEKKTLEDKNREQLLLALAVMHGDMTPQEIDAAETLADVPEDAVKTAAVEYSKNRETFDEMAKTGSEGQDGRLDNKDVQEAVLETSLQKGAVQYWTIENPGDGRTCEKCRKWIGKTVAEGDPSFPTPRDWMNDGAVHVNCRCSLHLVDDINAARQAKANIKIYNTRPLKGVVLNAI